MATYTGILHFHSETGTEGGYWAMQDEKFMGLVDERTLNTYHCQGCGRIWDKLRDSEEPKPSFTYWTEPWDEQIGPNHTRRHGGAQSYDEPHPEMLAGKPGSFDESYHLKTNAISQECYDNGHKEWKLLNPDGVWSYEGLHILNTGDRLTVFKDESRTTIKWAGLVNLAPLPLFTNHAGGMWIHSDQIDQDRELWAAMFFEGLPCTLETKEEADES